MLDYLDFEKPLNELDEKIAALESIENSSEIAEELSLLKEKSNKATKKIFTNLDDWQITQLARHPKRLYTLDYIDGICDDFVELHGDGVFADDRAIIGGMARINDKSVMIIGQQKGRTTKDKLLHNFGMPKPEGYRKALKIMRLAEKFNLPIVSLIDTPGAYPGIGAEERGQSKSIATNLSAMSVLKTPIIAIVIGEGGSGGALAIGVSDRTLMFKYSIYSVISPEGCASILYKDSSKASLAAKCLELTSDKLLTQGLIDGIIAEPLGGIHRDHDAAKELLKTAIATELDSICAIDTTTLLKNRQDKILAFGKFTN